MPDFNYLNTNSDFPKLGNVNTYKYDNEFNYDRFNYTQMQLQICTVPWDMGEAHIGNRTISGIGNVVYFGSKENRDKWFNAIPDSECYRFETKFKELHSDKIIDVPIPYDMCAKHNYLCVKYAKFANENSPVMYEGEDGLREWFWFIREVEFVAPNTTRLHLLDDAFQTWIYDINVSGMLLERGHAPMFSMRADDYLQNPIENCDYLLTEDVNFGDTYRTKHIDACVLNANDVYACIATTANVHADFGTKAGETWCVPAGAAYDKCGLPSVYVFALSPDDLYSFLDYINQNIPQFKQTIQAVFFASADLVTIGNRFTFGNVDCYEVYADRKTLDFVDLDKAQFNYPDKYANMAKLYTYPYAQIVITDENGTTDFIHIEDTSGKINVSAAVSLSYPFLTIDAHLMGIGGNENVTVSYKNIDERSFNISGNWYEYLRTWNIPTFAVVLDPSIEYDYSSYFDRKQARIDYYAQWDNTYDLADTQSANASLQVSANNSTTAASNSSASAGETADISANLSSAICDNAITAGTATSTIAANEMQGSISATANVANGVAGAVSNAVTGNPASAVMSAVGGIIGAATTMASTNVANGLTAVNAAFATAGNSTHAGIANQNVTTKVEAQIAAANAICAAENGLTSGATANTVATMKGNSDRSANAAADAITNGIKQAALRAPFTYGDFANGDSAANKPIALFAQIQTQSKAAISAAGDEFARYGYAFEKQWRFNGNWNIGKYFTYWKLRDFWVENLNVPDMYMDKIRFFLFGGVTVWRKPEYIGKIDIYDNFN